MRLSQLARILERNPNTFNKHGRLLDRLLALNWIMLVNPKPRCRKFLICAPEKPTKPLVVPGPVYPPSITRLSRWVQLQSLLLPHRGDALTVAQLRVLLHADHNCDRKHRVLWKLTEAGWLLPFYPDERRKLYQITVPTKPVTVIPISEERKRLAMGWRRSR